MTVRVYVGLGSNVEPQRHVPSALAALRRRFGALETSSLYETEAVGFAGAPFHNLAVGFGTDEPPEAVVAALAAIEDANGRDRRGPRFGPRTLDLDLLLYGDLVGEVAGRPVPRPELVEHAFMLAPMAELAPGLRHPVLGRTLAELWAAHPGGAIRRLGPAP
ncbi:2-amino-4-hydroxy-6-hydroxymethyldihydropteridine diphosphokinase [Inmirania thermothiophila]|uniref:2-amino-4-hydroxy-6-hydroxymethyldihydropteridine pyrophosphokinase n=1 Tax=Inmirania thermothiophila TaxID=1750597 RepID=A0A3N1Y6Q9_9GAMM|nr:2-amino-4-hydroxy-6-hydroxymethyldihydropteridine diphosphokinase [Inmirania thermothiophila]ROR34519.1 2-amino-4-hydroxy-6-hydroxymethyldihydropteridine diphosphokinase [Inmirania thermothiophila]